MIGRVLGFIKSDGMGTISASNEKRYEFRKEEWKEKSSIQKGMEVDFEIDENGMAKEIFLLNDLEVKHGWLSHMSRFEKYFWATIIFLAILYITAEIKAYVNTKNVQERKVEIINNPNKVNKENSEIKPNINLQNTKKAISDNLNFELKKLYGYINDTLVGGAVEKSELNKKLDLIHSKYLILLKEHMALMDHYITDGIDMDKIYSNLKTSQVLQASKEGIHINDTDGNNIDLDELKHELKNKYQVLFISTSKTLETIYFETSFKEEKQ